jgi:phosphoribosylformylglycinamidine synthase|tara:strand:- start:167 stop:397 length:231 start_codon:yes stop_codon:yes gene_type:complete
MKAIITVMLKNGVLDPQGEAVKSALSVLGFSGINGVRQGKVLELDLADGVDESQVNEMCSRLLVNAVIESYTLDIL